MTAYDSGYPNAPWGNPQVDFVWGNMPMQPNDDRQGAIEPGNGWDEYYLDGHTTQQDWGNTFYFNGVAPMFPSLDLAMEDSHDVALRSWNGYPGYTPDAGYTKVANWWEDNMPAFTIPNIIGMPLKDALESLRKLGVDEALLVDALSDNTENPYDYGDNIAQAGVVFWKYFDPEESIGSHWDGRPWLAKEAEGQVIWTGDWVGDDVVYAPYPEDASGIPWWYTFAVVQTTDPTKNSADTIWWW